MPHLTIVAHIYAHPDQSDFIKRELVKLIEPTKAEEGCLDYHLHQDEQNPAHFFFYENWTTRALWQSHMESAHAKNFGAVTEGAVAKVVLHELTRIG